MFKKNMYVSNVVRVSQSLSFQRGYTITFPTINRPQQRFLGLSLLPGMTHFGSCSPGMSSRWIHCPVPCAAAMCVLTMLQWRNVSHKNGPEIDLAQDSALNINTTHRLFSLVAKFSFARLCYKKDCISGYIRRHTFHVTKTAVMPMDSASSKPSCWYRSGSDLWCTAHPIP